jgi:hypothetical protein
MVLKYCLLIIFGFMMFGAQANIYNPAHYGEKDLNLYFGPSNLFYNLDPYTGEVIVEDQQLAQDFFEPFLSTDLKQFKQFFSRDLKNALSCPQSQMDRMYDYLRYANRIVAMSYLYESIRLQNQTAMKLGGKKQCEIDWQKVVSSCRPKSKDMQHFIKNAKHVVTSDKQLPLDVSQSIKKYSIEWLKDYQTKSFSDVSHYRLHQSCLLGNCQTPMTIETALSVMDDNCKQDTDFFIQICSENDSLYGMSNIYEAYHLIVNSDILTYFNDQGFAAGCLRRFNLQNKNKEVASPILQALFPITYQQLIQNDKRYEQGVLFMAGSLKQFIEKGVTSIYRETKPEPIIITKANKEKPVISKVEDKVEFIDKRPVKAKPVKKVETRPIEKKKEELKKTSFLIAVETQQQMDLDQVKVDMEKFKYDFIFSLKLKTMMDENLQIYTTRSGLEQMKKFDKLGSREGPVPLMFLKYLIETQKHQALFNMVSVIGERFYVNNDLDSHAATRYDYIHLRNDDMTGNEWQIDVLRVPEVVPPTSKN